MCSAWWRSETCNATWQMRPGIINCQFVIWDPGFLETADLVLGKSTWLSYFMLEHPQAQEKIPRRIIISIMLFKKITCSNPPNQNQLHFSSIFRQFLLLNRSTMISASRIASISTTSPSQPKAGGQGNSFTTATMSRNGSNTNQLDQCELTMSQCSYLLYFTGFSGCNHFISFLQFGCVLI